MNSRFVYSTVIASLSWSLCNVFAISPLSISVQPEKIIQGDPVMITIEGTSTISGIKSIIFGTQPLEVFSYDNKPRALYGVDLNKKPGSYPVIITLKDGTSFSQDAGVQARTRIEAPLGIPAKLGGNTASSQKTLVDTLAIENLSLLNIWTGTHAFWTSPFQSPVTDPQVTDAYGYIRQTGLYDIAHKGTDFRADTGTKVLAMNRGVVRQVRTYRNYGKTIVVDHGLGVMTFYMHLSKIYVAEGSLVSPGQVIGLSGQTGYAESPHLHLTVRINHISIDPITFLSFFK